MKYDFVKVWLCGVTFPGLPTISLRGNHIPFRTSLISTPAWLSNTLRPFARESLCGPSRIRYEERRRGRIETRRPRDFMNSPGQLLPAREVCYVRRVVCRFSELLIILIVDISQRCYWKTVHALIRSIYCILIA